MNLTNRIKKALLVSAFFYICPSAWVQAACVLPEKNQIAPLHHVTDGDTIKLVDGVSVRLLGLNTPELPRRGKQGQPLAEEASAALKTLLGERVLLVDGDTPQDRYGRRLSHVFSSEGRSAEEMLLRQGLGFFVGSDPGTGMADCLREAEREALQARRGVWSAPFWQPIAVNSPHLRAGFVVLKGRVARVEKTRQTMWIETDGDVVLKIDRKDLSRFPDTWWQQLEGQDWLIKGWMVDRQGNQGKHKRWLMRLMYPDMLVRASE
jgi:endonuclease YncB( thermonuclease family)